MSTSTKSNGAKKIKINAAGVAQEYRTSTTNKDNIVINP